MRISEMEDFERGVCSRLERGFLKPIGGLEERFRGGFEGFEGLEALDEVLGIFNDFIRSFRTLRVTFGLEGDEFFLMFEVFGRLFVSRNL